MYLYIYIIFFMGTDAAGAAFLAIFSFLPQFYSEKSRFRAAAAVPLFFLFFGAHLKKTHLFLQK